MIPRMMKASIFEIYGDASVLKFAEVPTPVPGRDEALVKVHAVGLNGYDLMARSGRYKPNKGKFPHILGGDFGGELVALGPETTSDLPLGTRVTSWWVLPCGRCDQCMGGFQNRCSKNYRYLGAHVPGAYAQYVKLPAHHLIALPDTVTYEQAAAFPNAFGTAWHMIVTRGNVRPGETVLVNSASSGVSMRTILPSWLTPANPYDFWIGIDVKGASEAHEVGLSAVFADPNVDLVLCTLLAPPNADFPEMGALLRTLRGTHNKPVALVLYGSAAARWTREIEGADIPVFPTVRAGARALAMVAKAAL